VETSIDNKRCCSLYKTFSRMSHSCYPNAWHWKDETNKKIVRATRRIESGEEICICYLDADDLLKSCPIRNEMLTLQKLFFCTCERCKTDWTRLFLCPKCKIGSSLCTWNGNTWPIVLKELQITCQESTCKHVFSFQEKAKAMQAESKLVEFKHNLPSTLNKKSATLIRIPNVP